MSRPKWKKVEECPRYSVSTDGQVRNDKTGRIMKQTTTDRGYRWLSLKVGGFSSGMGSESWRVWA